MAINIKNREAERLLAELKAATGKGTTRIVLELLREAAEQKRGDSDLAERRRLIREAQAAFAAGTGDRPVDADAIVGYDENGLPR